jgi:putative transposase
MEAATKLGEYVGIAPACEALAVSRATLYRHRSPGCKGNPVRRRSHRALSEEEQQQVLDVLNSERFVDASPAQAYAILLDEGIYYCSIRTMYRILAAHGEVRERRDQLRHPSYKKPELLATSPNEVWSWDITKLRGPVKWTYFYLYVILDIFSRYVVGWMVAHRESAELAKRLIKESCRKQGIEPDRLTVHADRGPSMQSKSVALLLSDLGVIKSHSRPYVSNDNPYSEAQFKTLKYQPEFPDRFGSIQDARSYCSAFFHYYNTWHRHSGIGLMTPEAVHYGQAEMINVARQDTLLSAYALHPERFVAKVPKPPHLPREVWINPPQKPPVQEDVSDVPLLTPAGCQTPLLESDDPNNILYDEMATATKYSTLKVLL